MPTSRPIRTALASAALAFAAFAATASPLFAQLATAPVLPLGRTVDGTLSRNDPMINEKGRFQIYRLDATAGRRYKIVMRADDFDSYLSIARLVGGLTDYMASDDDGAGNSNARLKWTAKESGTYYVIAQSLKAAGLGNFTVRLDTLPPIVITPPKPVTLGETITGELTETDPAVDDTGPFYDLYRITARKGQKLVIEMKAEGELDSYLAIGQMEGDSLKVDETNDDGGGGKNARLRYTVKEDGTYIIRAQSLEANGTGPYTLKVTEHVTRAPVIMNLAANMPTTGELTETDAEADDGSFYDLYRFTARAGEKVTITMRSSSVDSYLVLGQMVDGEWNQIAYDDDGAGGQNARLEHTFEAAGEYMVRANTVGAGATGTYTIRLERGSATTPRRRSSGSSESESAAAAASAPPAPSATIDIRPPRRSGKP